MTKISLNISGKVSSAHLKSISAIKKIADGLGIKFFVVGATARDFVLTCLYGVKAPRMTLDIDFGVEIKDWGSYVKIEKGLIESGQFKQSKEKQRFIFEDTIIDIIPFGDISNDKNQISWPPDYSVIMSVSGFEEACQHAIGIIFIKETSRTSQFHLVAHMMNTTHEFDDILVLLLKLKKGFFEMV